MAGVRLQAPALKMMARAVVAACRAARAAVSLAGLLRPRRPRPVHRPRRRHRPVRRQARPVGYADLDPARRERPGQIVVPAGRRDPLPGRGVRRLPLPPPGRRYDRDHPRWPRTPIGQIAQALLDATARPLEYQTPAGEPIRIDLRQAIDEVLGRPADFTTLRAALAQDAGLFTTC